MSKTVPALFLTMLQTSQYLVACDLYTLTLQNASVFYYTDGPQDITINGHTFVARTSANNIPSFKRGGTRMALGLQSETLEVQMLYDAATLFNSVALPGFVNAGGLDYATIKIDKFLSPSFSDVTKGTVNLFDGVVMDVEVASTEVRISVASDPIYLNVAFPRNYLIPTCNNSLFDNNCGLVKATWAVTGVAVTTSTKTLIHSNSLAQASGYFALGYIVITSGVNNGLVRTVKKFLSGDVTLLYPLPQACAVADTYTIYPGCDKTLGSNGCAKFSNLARNRSFPDVPTPELIAMGSSSSAGAPTDNSGAGAGGSGGGGSSTNFQQY